VKSKKELFQTKKNIFFASSQKRERANKKNIFCVALTGIKAGE